MLSEISQEACLPSVVPVPSALRGPQVIKILVQTSQLDTYRAVHVGLSGYVLRQRATSSGFFRGLVLFCDLVYYLVDSHDT